MRKKELFPELPILVVDDRINFLNSIAFTLGMNGITNVECCQESCNVMPLLEKKKYSVVLLDMFMPHIIGTELLPQIVIRYPNIPVIALTAVNDVDTAFDCVENGAIDHLVKPIETVLLLKSIRNALNLKDVKKENVLLRECISYENYEDTLFSFNDIEKGSPDYLRAVLRAVNILLRIGKAQWVINKVVPIIENKPIDKANVDFFYVLGQAYERIEEYEKAVSLYRDIEKFNSTYPGIQRSLKEICRKIKIYIDLSNSERYKIIKEVGRGKMGVVHMATDSNLDRTVALKILNRHIIKDESDTNRFFSEGKKLAQLHHPNITTVYDVGYINNDCFISMEFLDGINLSDLIEKRGPMSLKDILVIAKQLFAALAHSHHKGIIHRDVKPGNIIITYENELKVVDFGIAVLRDELFKDCRDEILGTPLYMSPEQIKGQTINHRTDIYSAGVTLFHLVTGMPPFNGSFSEIFQKHLNEPAPSIKNYRNDIPKVFIRIIEGCMEKNEVKRYRCAYQVVEKIDGIINGKNAKNNLNDKNKLKIFDTASGKNSPINEDSQTLLIAKKSVF